MDPVFRRKSDGKLILNYTYIASRYKTKSQQAKPDSVVLNQAKKSLCQLGGNPEIIVDVWGQYELQFGRFQGMTFKCMVDNALGYAAFLVDDLRKEIPTTAPISKNKFRLKVMPFMIISY